MSPTPGLIYTPLGNRWTCLGRPDEGGPAPSSDDKIALIGDSTLYQDGQGEARVRAVLQGLGWKNDNIYFYACIGKAVNIRDTNNRLTIEDMADARAQLGGEPAVWVFNLGSNGASSADATNVSRVNSVMDACGASPRKVVWIGLSQQTATDAVRDHFNDIAKPLVQARTNGVWADWNNFSKTIPQTGLWYTDGVHMNAPGYTWKNRFYGIMAGFPSDQAAALAWSPSKLVTSFVAPPTGSGYIRYQDIPGYNAGDSVQTNLNRLNAQPSPLIVTFPVGTFTLNDFGAPGPCAIRLDAGGSQANKVKGIIGSGRGTIFKMASSSSTVGGSVPPWNSPVGGVTNPCYIMIFRDIAAGCVMKNLSIVGTDQGHPYNGVQFIRCHGVEVSGVYLRGASPGDWNAPPGGTFGLNFWTTDNAWLHDSEIDGRDEAGTRVCASGFGWNTGSYSKVERTYVHHGIAGMPTWWEATHIYTEDLWSFSTGSAGGRYNGSAFNHERINGNVFHTRPSMKPWGRYETNKGNPDSTDNNGLHIGINSDGFTTLPTRVMVYEPIHDRGPSSAGAFGASMHDTYINVTNTITPQMVTVVKNGRELARLDANSPGTGFTTDTAWLRYH